MSTLNAERDMVSGQVAGWDHGIADQMGGLL